MKKNSVLAGVLSLLLTSVASGQDLITAYGLAQESDPKLREVKERLESTRETRNQARAQLLPSVNISSGIDLVNRDLKSSVFIRSGSDTFNDRNLALNLSQPIYRRDFLRQLEQSDHVIAQAEAEYAAAELDLLVRTASAYFDVLSAKDDLRVAKARREATGRQLEQAKQRFDVGLIAITDVHEAQAEFDGDRATEIQAENAVDNAWEALFEIIGFHQAPLAKLGDTLALVPPEPQNILEWADSAQAQNYSIIAARSAAESQRSNIEIQRSGHFPTFDLVGSYGFTRSSSDTATEADTGTVGVQLNVPLYTGGAVTSRTAQARYDFQAAQEVLDQQRRAVNRQVKDAYRGVLSSISQVKALKAATVSARSALESTQAGYDVGTRTIVDVLNVQRTLFEAEANYARSRYDYIVNGLRLKQAASSLSMDDLVRINSWLEE